MLDFSPFRPETNGRNEGAFRTLFRRPFRFGFYPREGSAPPEDPLRCTRGPFADAALPPSHATPSGLRPISRSAPLYGQRSDGAVECREHRPDAGRAPDHRDAPREQVSARRPNGQSAGSQVAPTANHYVLGLLHFKSVGLDGLQEHFPALRSMGLDDNGPGPGEP
jgi:hypothetical protein